MEPQSSSPQPIAIPNEFLYFHTSFWYPTSLLLIKISYFKYSRKLFSEDIYCAFSIFLLVKQPKIGLNINRFVLTLPWRVLNFMESNTIISFESPCGSHWSWISMFYRKRISKTVEMEQRDLQRFHRTSKRELNNAKEKNCKTGAILYTGTVLQTHGQKRETKRKGR
jgi:hypothetical protein